MSFRDGRPAPGPSDKAPITQEDVMNLKNNMAATKEESDALVVVSALRQREMIARVGLAVGSTAGWYFMRARLPPVLRDRSIITVYIAAAVASELFFGLGTPAQVKALPDGSPVRVFHDRDFSLSERTNRLSQIITDRKAGRIVPYGPNPPPYGTPLRETRGAPAGGSAERRPANGQPSEEELTPFRDPYDPNPVSPAQTLLQRDRVQKRAARADDEDDARDDRRWDDEEEEARPRRPVVPEREYHSWNDVRNAPERTGSSWDIHRERAQRNG